MANASQPVGDFRGGRAAAAAARSCGAATEGGRGDERPRMEDDSDDEGSLQLEDGSVVGSFPVRGGEDARRELRRQETRHRSDAKSLCLPHDGGGFHPAGATHARDMESGAVPIWRNARSHEFCSDRHSRDGLPQGFGGLRDMRRTPRGAARRGVTQVHRVDGFIIFA